MSHDESLKVLAEIAELALKVQELRNNHPEKSTKQLIQMAVAELEKQKDEERDAGNV